MIRLPGKIVVPVHNAAIRTVGNFLIRWFSRVGVCVGIAWLIVWAAGVPR
jgi:hypothetical protein